MVDVMAPVFDDVQEEVSRTRIRQARPRKQSPRGIVTESEYRRRKLAGRERHPRRTRARRDDDESGSSGSEDEDSGDEGRNKKNKHNTTSTRTQVITISTIASVPSTTPLSVPAATPVLLTTSPTPSTTQTTPTSLPPLSTLGPLPTVSDPAIVANPQQVVPLFPSGTPSFTPDALSTPTENLPAFTLSSNPRKGEDSGATILPSNLSPTGTGNAQSSPAAAFDSLTSPTIFIDDSGDNSGNGNSRDHDNHRDGPPGGLSPTAEDVLISAGSIGAFILICFVVWIGWRTLKKTKKPNRTSQQAEDSSPNNLLARIPYFGRNQRGWQDLDGSSVDMREQPPVYDAKSMGSNSSIYSINDPRHVSQSMSSKGMPLALPELQTNFTYSVGGSPYSASTMNGMIQPTSAQSMHSLASLQNALRASQGQQQQQLRGLPHLQTNFGSSLVTNNPFASPHDVSNPTTLSPLGAAQYSNGTMGNGTMETFDSLTTDRSRMPDRYYNQSELARQASTAFDPAKRAVYRASELSSISSGFGDGDFIIPAPPPAALQHEGGESRPISYAKSASRSRSNSVTHGNGQRDTVYTTTSEDMPARYRSVNSWVNQQTGRVQRQQVRDDDADVPPVPSLPPEDRYTLMMDDGEVPRRYEDTLSSRPPVPALPPQSQNNSSDKSGALR